MVLLALSALLAALAMLGVLFAERELSRRILPHVSIRGVPVGGLTIDDAHAALERAYAEFLYSPVEIQYGTQTWHPSAEELGVRLLLDEALVEAFALGRGPTRVEQIRNAAALWEYGFDLPLRLEFDQTRAQAYLLGVATAVEQVPVPADLRLEGTRIIASSEHWGTQSLIDESLADMTAVLQSLERQSISLRTRPLEPRVRDSEVAPTVAQLERMLAEPIILNGSIGACSMGCRWQIPPAQIATWLSLRRNASPAGRTSFTVVLDPAGIRNALQPIAPNLREEGTLPRVAWNGGNLAIISPGQPGRALDADQALAAISAAVYAPQRMIDLPIQPIPPPVTAANLNRLGITDRIGTGVSSFAASEQYRITNIRAGARQMHGVLIPPGASFSFNTQLGPVDASTGFVEGLAIINNRTQKEWGGGLCQVSTTVFRAAFFGGLPINERHAHAFRISWYEELDEPPGLDAAIFTPYNDMRFTNDTGNWLLMESYVDLERQRLSVALYGSPTGRSVSYDHRVISRTPAPTTPVYVNDPSKPSGYLRRSDTARGGLEVEVYRSVSRDGQIIRRDTFSTEFRPWPNIYVRGTGG